MKHDKHSPRQEAVDAAQRRAARTRKRRERRAAVARFLGIKPIDEEPELQTRQRSRRASITVSPRQIRAATKREAQREAGLDLDFERPRTRADCARVPRPCPYVGCRHNLYLEVTTYGGIQFNFPEREPRDMQDSCALDVAEDGPHTLDEVSKHTNLTRERTRQIEETAKHKLTVLQPRAVAMLRELGESE